MTDVAGRIALVTGAASGIGRLVALDLATRGARLVLWDLDGPAAEKVAGEIVERGGRGVAYRCDVGDRAVVYLTADRVRADVGDVDVLVNNAGVVSGRPFLELADEAIERTFRINTLALYWTTKAFLPAMVERNAGHVVTVASAAGLVGVAHQVDYSASKHAAVGFDESLRVELAGSAPGVHTTVVCPYYVDTGMFEGVHTRFRWLLPILRQEDVCRRMVRAIERNERRVVMPPLVHLVPLLHSLPPRVCDRVMDAFGINVSMEEFVGRTSRPGPKEGN